MTGPLPSTKLDTTPKLLGYQPALDGLRGVAVLSVVATHATLRVVGHGGFIGVDLFFVLSGYLITLLLLREHQRYGRLSLKAFYLRRALRLFPAMVAMSLIGGLVYVLVGDPGHTPARESALGAFAGLFYVSSWLAAAKVDMGYFVHTWSLSVEETFYAIWPLAIVWFAARRTSPIRAVGIAFVAAVGVRALVSVFQNEMHAYYTPYGRAEQLLAGCLVAAIQYERPDWLERMKGPIRYLFVVALAGYVGFVLFGSRPLHYVLGISTLIAVGSAIMMVHLVLEPSGFWARLLDHPVLLWFGKRSYGLYLWHVPIYGLLLFPVDGAARVALREALRFAVAVAVAAASYRWIEQPWLRRKEALTRHGAGSAVTARAG